MPMRWRKDRRRSRPDPGDRSILTRHGPHEAALGTEIGLWSGWSGSGPTISASRPTRFKACPGPMSASHSAPCCRPVRRYAAGRRGPSGDAVLSRQHRFDRGRIRSPASIAPVASTKTLHARFLELHTLGVRSGYSQDDVLSFAKVLTGWTLLPPPIIPSMAANSRSIPFARAGRAEGDRKIYEDETVEQGRGVLRIWPRIRRPPRTSPPAGPLFHCRYASASAG